MVIDKLAYDAILGLQFCKANKVDLFYSSQKLLINGEHVHFIGFNQVFSSLDECELPAYSERLIDVRPNHCLLGPVSIRNSDVLRERAAIIAASGLIEPNDQNRYYNRLGRERL